MLPEESRNLLEPCSSPVFDPGFRQVVGDVVEAAFAHATMIGVFRHGSMGRPAHSRGTAGLPRPERTRLRSAPVPGFLLVNPRAGSRRPTPRELADEAAARGIETHVLREGDDAAELARASQADALGIAGGDGSIAAVAAVALERSLPLVVVPFGTRNHFARDIGLDRDDPIAALDAFGSGESRAIDVGRVGDRLFLNNVSFGLYARLVHRRERHRRRRDAFARLRAIWLALRRRHPEPVVLDGNPLKARLVLVANNRYELDVFNIGERERLDEGRLHAYVAEGWWPRAWHERSAERFRIGAPGRVLRAAVDGEPVVLDSPAELRVEPRALRVLVPPERE